MVATLDRPSARVLARIDVPTASLVMDNYREERPEDVERLAGEIAADGIIRDPIEVADRGDGTFQVIGGHHRTLAARLLGLPTIPAYVVDVAAGSTDARLRAIRSNNVRVESDVLSEATAFADLVAQGLTVDDIHAGTGHRRDVIERRLALAKLDPACAWVVKRHGVTWAAPLAELPGDVQRALVRTLETDAPSRSRWEAMIAAARVKVAERETEQSAMFGGDFSLNAETWSTDLAAYLVDATEPEPEEVPAPVVIRERVLGPSDVADHLGVARGTVHKWATRGLLPAPDLTVSGAPAWWASTVDAWATATGRSVATSLSLS